MLFRSDTKTPAKDGNAGNGSPKMAINQDAVYEISIEKKKDNTYYATFKEEGSEEEDNIYIGITHVEDKLDYYVHDWRSPICSMFYDYEVEMHRQLFYHRDKWLTPQMKGFIALVREGTAQPAAPTQA